MSFCRRSVADNDVTETSGTEEVEMFVEQDDSNVQPGAQRQQKTQKRRR